MQKKNKLSIGSLSLLTIVVPTYNRQKFAIRQMNYWKEYSAQLIILDGSEFSISKGYIDNLPINITYYHTPIPLEKRLFKSVELVKTKYAMLLGDDEFYIPSAVNECIDELEKDVNIVSCMGLAARFWTVSNNKVLGGGIYERLLGYKVDQNSASERVLYHMGNYVCSSVYGVLRANVWKNNMLLISDTIFTTPVITELQFEMGTCIQGKSKVIDKLMWLRSGENPPVSTKNWNRDIDFLVWYKNKIYKDELKALIGTFLRHFPNQIQEKNLSKAFQLHFEFLLKRRGGRTSNIAKNIFINHPKRIIIYLFPSYLTSKLKWILNYLKYYFYSELELHDITLKEMFKDDKVDVNSLIKIENIINKK
jgi:glycosyltransferase domain-containing protein